MAASRSAKPASVRHCPTRRYSPGPRQSHRRWRFSWLSLPLLSLYFLSTLLQEKSPLREGTGKNLTAWLCRGGGMPRPPGSDVKTAEIGEKARRDREMPSPGGWRSAQRIRNLYDCRWQSYLYYAVSPQGLTDEVEAGDSHHRLVLHCSLRPHPVRLEPDHLPLQGKAFLRRSGALRLISYFRSL